MELAERIAEETARRLQDQLASILAVKSFRMVDVDGLIKMLDLKGRDGGKPDRTTLWRWEKDGKIPKSVSVAGGKRWVITDVIEWARSREPKPPRRLRRLRSA